MKGLESLQDKVVVITGGTRGIGFASVKAFLDAGAKVAMFGSRQETVDTALAELKKMNSDYLVKGYCPDLTNIKCVEKTVDEIVHTFGTIDILINNAGVSDATPVCDYDVEHFHNIMQINVDGVFNMIRCTTPIMRAKKKGVILNTSSMVSLYGQRSGVAYPTSKFAINGMTKSLARELGVDGIRVNAVAPGIIGTDMVKALDQNMIKAMSAMVPLQRVGEPEEIASTFLFLASDMAAYITGAVISVDGGFIG